MKKRILFVIEEQTLWQEFCTRFPETDDGWAAERVRTGAEALALVEPIPYTAVVADVQLSDMSGLELMDEVLRRQPRALRVLLSESEAIAGSLDCIGKGHRHLMKPCDAATLLETLWQAVEMEAWLPSKTVQGLIAQMRLIPSPPTIYFQIAAEMEDPGVSVERIGDLIARDPSITAKLLQLANSAAFGLRRKMARPDEAVAYVGMETTKALVLLAHTFSSFDDVRLSGFCVESLRWHSVIAGRFAKRIARLEDQPEETADDSFAAGLLHDIGKLLFAANLPEQFGQAISLVKARQCALWQAESEIFGACHAELGGCLLGIWGLSPSVITAVAFHHRPGELGGTQFCPLTSVHAANVFAHQAWSDQPLACPSEIDHPYMESLELASRIPEWQQDCLSPCESETEPEFSEMAQPNYKN